MRSVTPHVVRKGGTPLCISGTGVSIRRCLQLLARSRPRISSRASNRDGSESQHDMRGVLNCAEACCGCRLRGQPRGRYGDRGRSTRAVARRRLGELHDGFGVRDRAVLHNTHTPYRPAPNLRFFRRRRSRATSNSLHGEDRARHAGRSRTRSGLSAPPPPENRRFGGGAIGPVGVVENCYVAHGAAAVQFSKATTGNRTLRSPALSSAAASGCPRSRHPQQGAAPPRPPRRACPYRARSPCSRTATALAAATTASASHSYRSAPENGFTSSTRITPATSPTSTT